MMTSDAFSPAQRSAPESESLLRARSPGFRWHRWFASALPSKLAIAMLCALAGSGPPRAAAQAIPLIESIDPTSGPPGTQVTVVGRNFDAQTQVFLGNVALEVVSRSPARWVVRIPPGAQTGPLYVRNANGPSTVNPTFRITAAPAAPEIERIEPLSGPPGTEVVVRGQNFSARLSDNVVLLGDRPLVVRSATPFDVRVVVPEGAPSGPITVRVAGAGEARSAQPFTVTAAVGIADFQPRIGPPGTRVVLTGTGFSPTKSFNRVFLNNLPVRVESASATRLEVSIPAAAATGPIVVDVRGGTRMETPGPFVVAQPPTISAIEPPAAPPGREVTVRGANFGTDVRAVDLRIAGTPLVVRAVTPTAITAVLPADLAEQTARLNLNVAGLGPVQSPTDFTVLAPLRLAGFSPTSGPAGTQVTVTGQGFGTRPQDVSATISGARCEVVSVAPTQLVLRVPSAQSGPIEVTVAGSGAARTSTPFVVTRPPFVASFEPARVTIGGTVRIRGTDFGTNPAVVDVTVGGSAVEVVSLTDTEIVVRVPPGTRSGPVAVSVRLQGTSASGGTLTVDAPLAVSEVVPVEGAVGATVTVRGEGFTPGVVVLFGNAAATPSALVPNELRVTVPPGATTGPITVRTPDGRTASSAVAFTVQTPPAGVAIADLRATCTRPGCQVTLVGHGFSPRPAWNRVFFGDAPVRVSRASSTELVFDLPARPGTATFRVAVRRVGTAESRPFTITP
jgi:hypothetical protein